MGRTVKTLLVPFAIIWLGVGLPTITNGQGQGSGIRYTVTDLGTLGGPNSEAGGINNAGQIVGRADLAPDTGGNVYYHAFL